MALTNCKECKKEVSINAKTCPHCGVSNPGIIDNNRRVGVVVFTLISFLCIYIFTRNEPGTPAVNQEQPKYTEDVEQKLESVKQPKQELIQDNTKNVSSADTPQMLIMSMLEYALDDGGLSHESEIQQTKLQIESSPRPAKGNKKAARAINAKGLASSKDYDFNNAMKMFEEANKLDKSDIEIVSNLGFSYLKQGNLDSAQQAIIMALTMSPGRAAAWANLGEVFGARGDVSRAVACFSNTYRFSKNRLKTHQFMKKINQTEVVENVKQARAKAINWAEESYPNIGSPPIQEASVQEEKTIPEQKVPAKNHKDYSVLYKLANGIPLIEPQIEQEQELVKSEEPKIDHSQDEPKQIIFEPWESTVPEAQPANQFYNCVRINSIKIEKQLFDKKEDFTKDNTKHFANVIAAQCEPQAIKLVEHCKNNYMSEEGCVNNLAKGILKFMLLTQEFNADAIKNGYKPFKPYVQFMILEPPK